MYNKENVKKWTDALRSGKYVQTQGVLRKPGTNEMCCLGVLCDLYVKETGKGHWSDKTVHVDATNGPLGQVFNHDNDMEDYGGMPSREVMEWSGLDILRSNSFWGSLTELNDTGSSFSVIADVIENRFAEQEKFDLSPTS